MGGRAFPRHNTGVGRVLALPRMIGRRLDAEYEAYPQFRTESDGLGHSLHEHVRHPTSMRAQSFLTHGWPGMTLSNF